MYTSLSGWEGAVRRTHDLGVYKFSNCRTVGVSGVVCASLSPFGTMGGKVFFDRALRTMPERAFGLSSGSPGGCD